jgi:hypothetical protein
MTLEALGRGVAIQRVRNGIALTLSRFEVTFSRAEAATNVVEEALDVELEVDVVDVEDCELPHAASAMATANTATAQRDVKRPCSAMTCPLRL